MMIKDIHILQPHAPQALIEAGDQVLFRAPITVGAGPHGVTGFRGDDQLIAPGPQIGVENAAKVLLGGAGRRAVVIGQIEMGNAAIEGAADQGTGVVVQSGVAEVVPQAE